MTAQTDSDDLIRRLEKLESRVRNLEDTDAIRNLKARYAELCDDNYNPDGIALAPWQRLVGREHKLAP